MVDGKDRRFSPAASPRDFSTFALWLADVTTLSGVDKPGLQAALAAYVAKGMEEEASPQLIGTWIKRGSLPSVPRLRLVAEWARVPFEDLKALYDKDMEARQLKPRQRSGGRPAKKMGAPVARSKRKSPKPARSGSLRD